MTANVGRVQGARMWWIANLAVLLVAGCTTAPTEPTGGTLDLLEVPVGPQSGLVKVADAAVGHPGTGVWDSPDGVTVGRLPEGTYAVYGADTEWLQIQYLDGNGEASFGWIPTANTKLDIGLQSGNQ